MYNKIANEQIELTFGSTFFKTGKPAPRPKKKKEKTSIDSTVGTKKLKRKNFCNIIRMAACV